MKLEFRDGLVGRHESQDLATLAYDFHTETAREGSPRFAEVWAKVRECQLFRAHSRDEGLLGFSAWSVEHNHWGVWGVGMGTYVRPSARRHGVASALVQHAIGQLDCDRLVVSPWLDRTAPLQWLESLGFKPSQVVLTLDCKERR